MAPLVRKRSYHEVSGQTLLNLVRSLKRKSFPSDRTSGGEAVVEEEDRSTLIVGSDEASLEQRERPSTATPEAIRMSILDWTMSVQCSGLLKGDEKAAENILNPADEQDNNEKHSNNSVKSNTLQQVAVDAQHVLSSISRILDGGTTINDEVSLVPLAADLLTAVCDHIKTYPSPEDICFRAETELISKAAKPFLGSLLLHVDSFHSSTVAAATSLISLIGPKLSRSTDLLNRWHDAILRKCNERVGPRLIASLPFIGGKQIKPCDLYGHTLFEYHQAIRLWIESVASIEWEPRKILGIAEPISVPQAREELRLLAICKIVRNEWLPEIKGIASETEKIDYFESRLQFLLVVVVSLLRRDVVGCAASAVRMLDLQLGTRVMVDLKLVEDLLINFRAAARSLSSRTKKRLRSMTASNGVISIASTVSVAETVQAAGHTLLDIYVSTIGASGLLPFSKRLERLSSEAMWLSTSTVVQNALEPTTPSKTRRDAFVPLRISSMKSYQNVRKSFGSPPKNKRDRDTKANRAIAIVCATVVESLTTGQASVVEPSEGVELLVVALETLKTCLDSGGENLLSSVRNLIDSVGYTCFKSIHGRTRHPLLCYGGVRLAVIRFAGSMLFVPHQDGSASNSELRSNIRLVADVLRYDQDDLVAAEAISLLQVSKAISCPRRPTLHIAVKHDRDEAEQPVGLTVGPVVDLAEKIAISNMNLDAAKAVRVESDKKTHKKKVAAIDTEQEEPKNLSILFPSNSNSSEPFVPQASQNTLLTKTDQAIDSYNQGPPRKPIETISHSTGKSEEGDETDDDMPLIVDCGPDEEDEE